MSPRSEEIVTALIAAGVLFIALRWGVIGIRGISVERSEEPITFWGAVVLMVFILLGMVALLATGK